MSARPLRAAALGVGLLACSSASVVNTTYNVLRATDVAFVCLDVRADARGLVRAVPLSRCALNTDNSSASGDLRLHALMIQQTRGELAVVDLAATSGTSLLDISRASPGFSFQPTLSLPTALVVDVRGDRDPNPSAPPVVWVASASQQRIQRIDARGLRRDPSVPATLLAGDFATDGAAKDLAIDTVGGRRLLYATMPERGVVAVYDVTDPSQVTTLATVSLRGAGADAGVTDAGVAAARPASIAVDARTHRVFVGDEGAPVVHALEGFPLREVATIPFGVPTRALALTGWVRARRDGCDPATDPDHCAYAQYLYGVSGLDGSVRVWDLVRGVAVRPNVLPGASPRLRRLDPAQADDRVALPAPATSLVAINTPDYDEVSDPLDPRRAVINANAPCDGAACPADTDPPRGPATLRGVFVGALLRTGAISIIDLDDYDAPCRARACSAQTDGGAALATSFQQVRHAPRSAVRLEDTPKLREAPEYSAPIAGGTSRARVSERAVSPVIACADTRSRADLSPCASADNYGVQLARRRDDASVVDAFAVRNEAWAFTWEGVLPGLDQAGGALSVAGDLLRLDAPGAAFCARGALAQADGRDLVTIVGDPAPLAAERAACADAFGTSALPVNRDFVVDAAYQDRLLLRGADGTPASLVARCFPQATRFQVRANGQWIAQGGLTGFQHAVRAGADGRCEVDPARQAIFDGYASLCVGARLQPPATAPHAARCPPGRACLGAVNPTTGVASAADAPIFANSVLCLQIYPAIAAPVSGRYAPVAVARDAQLGFAIENAWEPFLDTQAGTFPLAMRYLPGVERLYVVDTASAGLVEYLASPFGRTGRSFN